MNTYADRLLMHMKTCHTCIGAKAAHTHNYCTKARELVRLATEERHGMNNEERRRALARARELALEHAEAAQRAYDDISEDGPEAILAVMWSNVAQAMKIGENRDADGVKETRT